MNHVQNIYQNDNKIVSIIIRNEYTNEGIKFFSSENDSQQLGYMNRPSGYIISPHIHNFVKREVNFTQEVLFIKNGKVRVDFYTDDYNYLKSTILFKGDVILLLSGGHGFKMMEDSEIIEVKQGPYCGEDDKVRFKAVDESKIILDNEF
jgi:hypothetical protein